jgi:hypothetical protein
MKAIHWIIAAAAFASVLPAPADAATFDPEVIIYRFPGVTDNAGMATVFFCTNFSGVTENIRFVTRAFNGDLIQNSTKSVVHLGTITVNTHQTAAYAPDLDLATGTFSGGTTAIAATSTNIICTAMTIDAANPKPDGVALRGIRFNPVPGSQE